MPPPFMMGAPFVGSPVWDPASRRLSLWWQGSFSGAPWLGRASALSDGVQISGNNTSFAANSDGHDPSVGPTINGRSGATFVAGSGQYLVTAPLVSGSRSVIGNGTAADASTGAALIYVDALTLDNANRGFNHVILADGSPRAVWGVMGRAGSGTPTLDAIWYDNGFTGIPKAASKAISLGQWLLAYWVVDVANAVMRLSVDSGAEATVAIGAKDADGFGPVCIGGFSDGQRTSMKTLGVIVSAYANEFTRAEALSYYKHETGLPLT